MRTFAIAAVSFAILATPAFAGDVEFSYARSELESSQTVATLYNRLENRAENACYAGKRGSIAQMRAAEKCADALKSEFVAAIGSQSLTSLHEARHSNRFASSN